MVFQEQVSQAAMSLAGFDPAEADTLRKVISKKHKEKKIRDFHARFVQGALERGVERKVIEEVWRMMMEFDGYSFCKPHSASYTLVAYKSAYLRAHYPAEFMASVISNGGGYYSTLGYVSEARRMGLTILIPDINLSEIKYTGKQRNLRVGFMQLKELSRESTESIIHERSRNGPFTSFRDFLERIGNRLTLHETKVLIKAGCFDGIAGSVRRAALLWQALSFFNGKADSRSPDLFHGLQDHFAPKTPKGGDRPYPEKRMMQHEHEVFGFLLSRHPLDPYRATLNRIDHVRARDLTRWVGKDITAVGWQVTGKTVHTNRGEPMKFITFEDQTGTFETVFFPDAYHQYCHLLHASRPYLIRGRVEQDLGVTTLTAHSIKLLHDYEKRIRRDRGYEIARTLADA
jgi:error-prone DNA polymerase